MAHRRRRRTDERWRERPGERGCNTPTEDPGARRAQESHDRADIINIALD
jgi:hypothetical protein